ncbi:MAG: hypothetical protein M1549_00250 [Candidatus Dependentiae bacterium]|nr:hypothetical protein [Candidatus Dependentiae bacterium]
MKVYLKRLLLVGLTLCSVGTWGSEKKPEGGKKTAKEMVQEIADPKNLVAPINELYKKTVAPQDAKTIKANAKAAIRDCINALKKNIQVPAEAWLKENANQQSTFYEELKTKKFKDPSIWLSDIRNAVIDAVLAQQDGQMDVKFNELEQNLSTFIEAYAKWVKLLMEPWPTAGSVQELPTQGEQEAVLARAYACAKDFEKLLAIAGPGFKTAIGPDSKGILAPGKGERVLLLRMKLVCIFQKNTPNYSELDLIHKIDETFQPHVDYMLADVGRANELLETRRTGKEQKKTAKEAKRAEQFEKEKPLRDLAASLQRLLPKQRTVEQAIQKIEALRNEIPRKIFNYWLCSIMLPEKMARKSKKGESEGKRVPEIETEIERLEKDMPRRKEKLAKRLNDWKKKDSKAYEAFLKIPARLNKVLSNLITPTKEQLPDKAVQEKCAELFASNEHVFLFFNMLMTEMEMIRLNKSLSEAVAKNYELAPDLREKLRVKTKLFNEKFLDQSNKLCAKAGKEDKEIGSAFGGLF